MKVEINKTVKVNLLLEEREAEMLKHIVQNPITDDEPLEIRKFKSGLWDLLNYNSVPTQQPEDDDVPFLSR